MLLGYIWLLGTFVNSSCDIKINIKIVQNCSRNLAVMRGLSLFIKKNQVVEVFLHYEKRSCDAFCSWYTCVPQY